MLTFDHAKLISGQPREMKRFRKYLLEAESGVIGEIAIAHEPDGSCCRDEDFGRTWQRITDAVKAPTKTLPINLDHTPDCAVSREIMKGRREKP